ncbi:MAG: hypothetical protein SGARI_000009 [Bacillariaceae sp.]
MPRTNQRGKAKPAKSSGENEADGVTDAPEPSTPKKDAVEPAINDTVVYNIVSPPKPPPKPSRRLAQREPAKKQKIKGISQTTSIQINIQGQRFDSGVAVIEVTTGYDPRIEGYSVPLQNAFKNDEDLMEQYKIFGIFDKRHGDISEDKAYPSNHHKAEQQERDLGQAWIFKCFVRIYENKEDNTYENMMEWLKMFKLACERYNVGKNMRYPNVYHIVGDITPGRRDGWPQPISNQLCNRDVMRVMMELFPGVEMETLAYHYAEEFFDYIRNFRA